MDKENEFLKSSLAKVRGIFDTRKKVIYLDLSQYPHRKNFVTLNESVHGILPWQHCIHQIIGDNDLTISFDQTEEFEAAANYFASITLFKQDRFQINFPNWLWKSIQQCIWQIDLAHLSIQYSFKTLYRLSKDLCALIILEVWMLAEANVMCGTF
jgi:hypothetical protein